ncbi:MAG: tRNA epoxyqueuosine(34) reductase QueG [Desulfobacterales bacterium]|nr:tRNA epoxyqueuosine(34) reductase QueG [Desulfobacterales bacterium]
MLSSFVEKAKELGFVSIGFSRPERPLFFKQYCEWIAGAKQGQMSWLESHLDIRERPRMLLDDCKIVISLAYPYPSEKPCTPDGFTAARYSQPDENDYHDRLRKLCNELTYTLTDHYPESKTRVCVDSAPIMERSFAYTSGIGFIGKNNMLIIPGHGSYIFLVEILTTTPLFVPKAGQMDNQCLSCTLCIDACPTGALEGPFSINASKCLSYLTIEHNGTSKSETGKKMSDCFLGCDVCQEVCPFNKGRSSGIVSLPATDDIMAMDQKDFNDKFKKTAFNRAGLDKIKGNIAAIKSSHKNKFTF